MWEEGACIYGTPGVHNNFPFSKDLHKTNINLIKTNKKKILQAWKLKLDH